MRYSMLGAVLTLTLIGVLTNAPARATIKISPAQPTTGDSVKVTVGGGFASLCWPVDQTECGVPLSDTLATTVTVNFCGGAPSCECAQVPEAYEWTCNFGVLRAGTFIVKFTESHINSYDPLPTRTQYAPFVVTVATPTLRRSWGTLKSIYR